MIIVGFAKVIKIKEDNDIIKGLLQFVSEKTKTIETIGFTMAKNNSVLKALKEIMQNSEMIELTGKLFKEGKLFYINIIDIKNCRLKYKMFSENEEIGIEI